MKVWAQDEFDLVKTGADGQYRFGKGDFRRVDMRGYTRLIIGAGSLLGEANVGVNSEIGAHCDFDAVPFRKRRVDQVGLHRRSRGMLWRRRVDRARRGAGGRRRASGKVRSIRREECGRAHDADHYAGCRRHAACVSRGRPGLCQLAGTDSASGGVRAVCSGSGGVCGIHRNARGRGRGQRAAGCGELYRDTVSRGVNLLSY